MSVDGLIIGFDKALRAVIGPSPLMRPMPGQTVAEGDMDEDERRHAAALMRINHVGEVCAQALYQGQAVASSTPSLRAALAQAADEESEHLAWTERRIEALGGHKSLLNPLWYAGAFCLGVAAGKAGDRWNLGFLAETERQVEAHLDDHLERLPPADERSREVLRQMRLDEIRHAETAVGLGAAELPGVVKAAMKFASRLMTRTAYYL